MKAARIHNFGGLEANSSSNRADSQTTGAVPQRAADTTGRNRMSANKTKKLEK